MIFELFMKILGKYFSKHRSEAMQMQIEEATGLAGDYRVEDEGEGPRGGERD